MRALIISSLVFLCGCATTATMDWISTGPVFPAKNASDVQIFRSKKEVVRPCRTIGVVLSSRVDAGDESGLLRQEKKARALAASRGADAVIVTRALHDSGTEDDGLPSKKEAFVSVMALKFVDGLSDDDKQRIADWSAPEGGF